MPQFDILSFFVQVIYVSAAFMFFYLIAEYYFLVKVSQAVKARKKAILLSSKLLAAKNKQNQNAINNIVFKHITH
jgi:hypothetical protein